MQHQPIRCIYSVQDYKAIGKCPIKSKQLTFVVLVKALTHSCRSSAVGALNKQQLGFLIVIISKEGNKNLCNDNFNKRIYFNYALLNVHHKMLELYNIYLHIKAICVSISQKSITHQNKIHVFSWYLLEQSIFKIVFHLHTQLSQIT